VLEGSNSVCQDIVNRLIWGCNYRPVVLLCCDIFPGCIYTWKYLDLMKNSHALNLVSR